MKQLFLTIFALLIVNISYAQVKATSSEISTGTDDDKFATALALQGSKYLDQNGGKVSAVTAAGANTYIASITPAITAYSMGQVFYIKITTANTGASTLNLNGLGAKALVKDASTALVAGDLLANKVYAVYYDGVNFQVMNLSATVSTDYIINQSNSNVVQPTANFNISGKGTIGERLHLGASSSAAVRVYQTLPISGGTIAYGFFNSGVIGNNVTTAAYAFNSSLTLETPGQNLPALAHYAANQVALPTDAVVQTQYGFLAAASLVGAGVNKGFESRIPVVAGKENWNFYANGTAPNYLAGNLALGATAQLGGLTVWQKSIAEKGIVVRGAASGTANLLEVQNSAGTVVASTSPTAVINNVRVVNNTLSQRIWDPATTVTGSRSFYDITYYNNGTEAPVGELRVDLPIGTSTMWVARITMMEYDKTILANVKTTDLIITGYAVSNVNFSVLCNAPDRIAQVRIGRNAANTKTVLMITTNDGTLKYLKANLKEFTVYHTSHTAAAFEDPSQYNMSLATDDTDYVHTRTILNSGFVRDSYALNYNNLTNKPVLGNTVLKAGDAMTGKLTISSTENAKLILQQSAVNQQNIIDFRNESGTSMGYIGKPSAASNNMSVASRTGDVTFVAADVTRLTISPTLLTSTIPYSGTSGTFSGLVQASSVGIGTPNVHNYKLAVAGGIIAESVKVKPQGSWPDYVFEKNYPILPLNELEKFVLKNKHLPNVPNAAEVKKDGIDVGEMNAKLLQKIEELTLYIIEQQKSIVDQQLNIKDQQISIIAQQKEIKDLKGKVNEMTKLSEEVEKLSAEMNLLKNK
ncbi:hypothetical protein [Pedobacter nyackensis]|uniref:hypothetical protein n=1 Tax=Pedobacter nyackensis TaxID=475255 RepID=UPI00292D7D88|nr:hypothetical protein [Pedobacter nyackensis]